MSNLNCARLGLGAGPTGSWSMEVKFESMDARSKYKGNSATLDNSVACAAPPGGLPGLLRASLGCDAPSLRPSLVCSHGASRPSLRAARGLPLRRSASRTPRLPARALPPPPRPRDASAAASTGLAMEGRPAVVGH